jgi:hypothetical protein
MALTAALALAFAPNASPAVQAGAAPTVSEAVDVA